MLQGQQLFQEPLRINPDDLSSTLGVVLLLRSRDLNDVNRIRVGINVHN